MTTRSVDRREQIRRQQQKRKQEVKEEAQLFKRICTSISQGRLIPIIGDTVRKEHIFDIDFDKKLGIAPAQGQAATKADCSENGPVSEGGDDNRVRCDLPTYNVTERLACEWADELDYPLADRYRIARVAQYLSVTNDEVGLDPKEEYLSFQKRRLLEIAREAAEAENDDAALGILDDLDLDAEDLSFSEIVSQLDYPRFPEEKTDPLEVLARLPIPIYLTTSYHDFLERALIDAGREPRTQICPWNIPAEVLPERQRPLSSFTHDEEAIRHPIVYHLFGLEDYSESLVLSEDDYMDYLVRITRESADHMGGGVIPPFLEASLSYSSLLLLGYRLHDWDFRVLFRGLLNVDRNQVETRRPGVAIQLYPNGQPEVKDVQGAKTYLNKYFKGAKLQVHWNDTDSFVAKLCDAWATHQAQSQEGKPHEC